MTRLLTTLTVLLLSVGNALAEPTEDAKAVISQWAEAFIAKDVDQIVGLYQGDALFWPTIINEPANNQDAARAYFVAAFKHPNPATKVEVTSRSTLVLSDEVVVDAGVVEVSRDIDGTAQATPLRFHFVLAKSNGDWKIAAHHSSLMPVKP